MKLSKTNINKDVTGKNKRFTEKTQFTNIIMNLDTWIKDFLKGTWVGGTLTKFSQEEILKETLNFVF